MYVAIKMSNTWDYQEGDLLEIDFHGREKKIGIISRVYQLQLSRYPFEPYNRYEFCYGDGLKLEFYRTNLDNTKTIKVLARAKNV